MIDWIRLKIDDDMTLQNGSVKTMDNKSKLIYTNFCSLKAAMKPLTRDEQVLYNSLPTCYVCDNPFSDNNIEVRDHFHLTDGYGRGACMEGNLNFQFPLFFHNPSEYNLHLCIRKLALNENLDVIEPITQTSIRRNICRRERENKK